MYLGDMSDRQIEWEVRSTIITSFQYFEKALKSEVEDKTAIADVKRGIDHLGRGMT